MKYLGDESEGKSKLGEGETESTSSFELLSCLQPGRYRCFLWRWVIV